MSRWQRDLSAARGGGADSAGAGGYRQPSLEPATLRRETFTTSRLLEFFTATELTMQIGHPQHLWLLALLKELVDNGLDACETAGVAPAITVVVEEDAVRVRDNGPGLPTATLTRSLDYAVRVSDKAYYASPTRGQLGNALKCLYAAPYVVDGVRGSVEVTTGGITHTITVTLDRIRQVPALEHTTRPDGHAKTGTEVTIHWPGAAIAAWKHGRRRVFTSPTNSSCASAPSTPTPHSGMSTEARAGA